MVKRKINALQKLKKTSKYNNNKTIINGIKFDSQKEAYRYKELKLLERAKAISNLELQPKYMLTEPYTEKSTQKKVRASFYIADFKYKDQNGNTIVEDTKGFKTDIYKLKKKLMHKLYDIEIIET